MNQIKKLILILSLLCLYSCNDIFTWEDPDCYEKTKECFCNNSYIWDTDRVCGLNGNWYCSWNHIVHELGYGQISYDGGCDESQWPI